MQCISLQINDISQEKLLAVTYLLPPSDTDITAECQTVTRGKAVKKSCLDLLDKGFKQLLCFAREGAEDCRENYRTLLILFHNFSGCTY